MYTAHFGLNALPFSSQAAPETTYQSSELLEALAHFTYAIENRDSLLLLSGEVGSGKTTAVRMALCRFRRDLSVAVVGHATFTPREVLEAIAISFSMGADKKESKPRLLQRLEAKFSRCREAGHPALLIFDEAHLLKPAVLEELRLLSNLTRNGEILVQIFLVGQPELEKRLLRNRSLRQRITVRYRIKPLTREETKGYIAHRLKAAGCSKPYRVFPEGPMEVVYGLSKGLPREINVIAGYAMLNCYLNDGHQVTCEHVRSVVTEYSFEGVTEAPPHEESSDSRSQVVQPLKVATKAETTKSAGRFGVGRWSSKAVLSAIAALVVLAAITIGMLRDNPPEKGGGRRVESVPSPTGALAAAPGEESFGTEPDPSPATEEAGSAKSHLDRTFSPIDAEPHLPVIKVDRVLSDEPNQRVTVQIASMLDQELAEISLAKASARTDMPGAVETVPVGDTTWHLVLLGCFRSVEEAEIAVQPMLPILKEQAVTEVRIKPAPGWLEESLIKRQ